MNAETCKEEEGETITDARKGER